MPYNLYAEEDTTAPQLVEFSFSPTTVNVSSGDQTATFTLRITDNLSGFKTGWLKIDSPSGQQSLTETIGVNRLINGDTLDGVYEFTMTFPQFSETGFWCVTSMFLKDDANNIGYPDLNILECIEIVSTAPDTTPPQLVEFSFSPTIVNVSSGDQTATFTLRITDNLSGFSTGWLKIDSPSGQQSLTETIGVNRLINGDTLDGVYEFTMTFPQFSETGFWCVTSMFLKDDANNIGYPDLNILECIEIVSTAPDTTPPQLVEFSFSPTIVNVSSGDQTATFTLRITDDLSGFSTGWLKIDSPSGQQSLTETIGVNRLINGDTLDGVYEFTMTFPQFSETGFWCVTSMFLKDDANNIGYPDLNILECIEIVSTAPDTTPPQLVEFSFSPTIVNVSSGDQTATFTLRITDNLSGFKTGWLKIDSPSGQQSLTETIGVNRLINGDTLDGVYEFTMTFPQFSETGFWCVTSMFLKDDANNIGYPDLNILECIEIVNKVTIDAILSFFDQSVADGTLIGHGHGNSANGRLNALRNMLETVSDLIDIDDIEGACRQLRTASRKCDRESPPPDFVAGEAVGKLNNKIMELMAELGCE